MSDRSRVRRAPFAALLAGVALFSFAGLAYAEDASVNIIDYAFDPPDVTVNVGDTVTWTNTGEDTHTVKWDGEESRPLSNSDTYQRTFDTAGTFAYVCGIHASMTGSVTVADAGGEEPSPTATGGEAPASPSPSQPPTDTEVAGTTGGTALPVWWFMVIGAAGLAGASLFARRLSTRR